MKMLLVAVAGRVGDEEPALYVYHELPGGGFFELVDETVRSMLTEHFGKGE